MDQRMSKDKYYLNIADAVLDRSTCLRRMPPIMSRRAAEMMALASACTLRHSSYRWPLGMRSCSRLQ